MKKNDVIMIAVLSLVFGVIIGGLFGAGVIHDDREAYKELQKELQAQRLASDKYVWACERLLDRICEDDESFYDTTVETPEYDDYLKAKGNVYVPNEQP